MNSYFLDITGAWIILILLLLLAIAFSFYSYRNTNPPLAKTKRNILIALRSIALCLIIFALFEPIYTVIKNFEKPAQLVVLLDDSQSVAADDASGSRKKQYEEILSNINFKEFGEDIHFYKFSDKIRKIENFHKDSLKLQGSLTNISEAIKSISLNAEENNFCSILLITDGAFNDGNNPVFDAENFANPIYTIGVGDTVEPKDVSIISLLTNEIAYIDNPVPINVNFKAAGFSDEVVKLTLFDNGKKINEQEFSLSSARENYTAILDYLPIEEGTRKITATLSNVEGEITIKNNSISEFIKVLKNKRTIALFAGYPSPDLAFIKRTLQKEKGLEVLEFVQKRSSEFYVNPTTKDLAETDIFIFCGFPIQSTPNQLIANINNELNKGKPIFFLAGLETDYKKLKELQENLPFTLLSSKQREFTVTPDINIDHLASPILRITGTDEDILLWNKMPPIFKTETFVKAKPESEVISTMKVNNVALKEPLIVTREIQGKKSVAIMGYGLYRWKLLSYASDVSKGITESPDLFETLLSNTFRWLSVYEKNKTVNVRTAKKHYNQSEKVEFIAELYDAAFVPVENAEISVNISKNGADDRKITLVSIGNGRYYSVVEGLSQGDFSFNAEAKLGQRKLGNDSGRFTVGELSVEFQNLKQNTSLLQTIAKRTGAKYYELKDINALVDDIKKHPNFKSKAVSSRSEFLLWNWIVLLSLAILCFTIEWFLRKRAGLL